MTLFCGIVKWLERFFNPGLETNKVKIAVSLKCFSKTFMKTIDIFAFLFCMFYYNLVSPRFYDFFFMVGFVNFSLSITYCLCMCWFGFTRMLQSVPSCRSYIADWLCPATSPPGCGNNLDWAHGFQGASCFKVRILSNIYDGAFFHKNLHLGSFSKS